MTIQEMNDTLKTMKSVYNFKDEKTDIKLEGVKSFEGDTVFINTIDDKTNVNIEMFLTVKPRRENIVKGGCEL